MKNREKFKKSLFLYILLIILFLIINTFIYKYEINNYNENYNKKINNLIYYIENKYSDDFTGDIAKIINSDNDDVLNKYGINNNDYSIKENEVLLNKYIICNSIFIIFISSVYLLVFLIYNYKKNRDINNITRCIQNINNKIYDLEIDENSEDELSILKNEIYKTTIMLKCDAENSRNDKLELKESLTNIHHQLKTPITSILIMLDNISSDENMDNDTKMEFIKDIRKEIVNINFLVQAILKLTKLDTNTVKFNKEEVLLSDIINESIKKVDIISELNNVNVRFNIIKDSNINVDYKWQVEAVSNIIKNSIEYTKTGGEVLISIDSNKLYSEVIIKDNGIGISKSELDNIFKRFYTGSSSNFDSVGIGLSLSKSIIEKSGGDISVSSKNGAIFKIRYFKS